MNGAVLDALGGGDGRLARADKLSLVGGDDGGTDEGDRRRRKRRHLRLHETERRVRGQFVFDRTAKRSRARSRLLVASRVAGAPVVVQRAAIENSVVRDKARVLDAVGARSEGRHDSTGAAGASVQISRSHVHISRYAVESRHAAILLRRRRARVPVDDVEEGTSRQGRRT